MSRKSLARLRSALASGAALFLSLAVLGACSGSSSDSGTPDPLTITASTSGIITTVTMSATDSSAVIYYTSDGYTPTTSSPEYSDAITICGTAVNLTVQAVAYVSGAEWATATKAVSASKTISSGAVVTTLCELGISTATGIVSDGMNLYVEACPNNNILKVTPSGSFSVFAGSTSGASGQADGTGTEARFYAPTCIATDGFNLT